MNIHLLLHDRIPEARVRRRSRCVARRDRWPRLQSLVLLGLVAAVLHADVARAQQRDPESLNKQAQLSNPQQVARATGTGVQWTFRALSPVSISSPIIRLGDVAAPVGVPDANWPRLRRAAVGLVPLDGSSMTLDRARLTRMIQSAHAGGVHLEWIGPTHVVVNYRPGMNRRGMNRPVMDQSRMEGASTSAVVQPASSGSSASAVVPASSEMASATMQVATRSLDHSTAKRVVHWIQLGLQTLTPEIEELYAVEIDPHQHGLVPLKALASVTSLKPIGELTEGPVRFQVSGRSVDGPIQSNVIFQLTPHPLVVVPRKSLGRGHRITANDLEMQPIPEDRMSPDYFRELGAAVGMEVRSSIREGHPIESDDVGAPILVHRGDLIEIQVMGGGIRVTTNAKSLGDGAASELIEIETLQPRKRLVARVVQPGLVEIVTRAPQVRR